MLLIRQTVFDLKCGPRQPSYTGVFGGLLMCNNQAWTLEATILLSGPVVQRIQIVCVCVTVVVSRLGDPVETQGNGDR